MRARHILEKSIPRVDNASMSVVRRRVEPRTRTLLSEAPIVAMLGARQVGKSTLARMIAESWPGPAHRFDLEDPAHLGRLAEPGLVLRDLQGLVVLDEIQRCPELFPLLRVLADRPEAPARFLILGSASPSVVRGVSETLAGRVAFARLDGFDLAEIGAEHLPPALRELCGTAASEPEHEAPGTGVRPGLQLAAVERDLIEKTLEALGGNRTRTAAALGLSRRALLYKLKRYGIG